MLSCLYSHIERQLIGWYAAGYLNNSTGALNNRGSNGNYWSSTENSSTNGYNLKFNSTNSNLNNNNKANGFSVRCLSDYETKLPKCPPRGVETRGGCGGNVQGGNEWDSSSQAPQNDDLFTSSFCALLFVIPSTSSGQALNGVKDLWKVK